MNNKLSHSSSHSGRRGSRERLSLRLFAVAGCFALTAPEVQAQENQLEVDVRPSVTDKSIIWSNKPKASGEGGHGKIYGIASVAEIRAGTWLIKPVDEDALVSLVLKELDRNGFREFQKGEKPDILLTVSYGRGDLTNPYIRDQGEVGGSEAPGQFSGVTPDSGNAVVQQIHGAGSDVGHANDSGATSVSITGAAAHQLFDEKSHGFEQRLQRAGYEKLYIRISAWAYPTAGKAKPKMLWKTIMCVDDPDNRDLNAVAAKMLEAGAPYFDKTIRDPEAIIFKPLAGEQVNVGTPEVVEGRRKP